MGMVEGMVSKMAAGGDMSLALLLSKQDLLLLKTGRGKIRRRRIRRRRMRRTGLLRMMAKPLPPLNQSRLRPP
jgi:hypothetical protein